MSLLSTKCGWHSAPLPGLDVIDYSPATCSLAAPKSSSPQQMMLNFKLIYYLLDELSIQILWRMYKRFLSFFSLVSLVFDCQGSSVRKAGSLLTSVVPRWVTRHVLLHLQAGFSHLEGRLSINHPESSHGGNQVRTEWHVAGGWDVLHGRKLRVGHVFKPCSVIIFFISFLSIWSEDFFFICTNYIFLAIHNILFIFKRR